MIASDLSASHQLAYKKKHMVKWHLLKPQVWNDSHNPGMSHYLISCNKFFLLIAAPLKNTAKSKVLSEFRGAIFNNITAASKLALLRYDCRILAPEELLLLFHPIDTNHWPR